MPKSLVFIIEDYSPMRRLLLEWFKHGGWDVWTTATVEAALEHIRVQGTSPHLILLDYTLTPSGLSGLDAVKAMRTECPTAVLIIYTGNNDPKDIFPALAAGADEWMVKGDDDEALKSIVLAGRIRRKFRNQWAMELNRDQLG